MKRSTPPPETCPSDKCVCVACAQVVAVRSADGSVVGHRESGKKHVGGWCPGGNTKRWRVERRAA